MTRWHLWVGLLTAGMLGGIASGCGKSEGGDQAGSCSENGHCAGGQICRLPGKPGPDEMLAMPCGFHLCDDDTQCSSGQICEASGDGACSYRQCVSGCASSGCLEDEYCADDGRCQLVQCDEPGAAACPEHWQCDPAQAQEHPVTQVGSEVAGANPERAIARGCVRLPCDDSDGFVCRSLWECDPAAAVDASGCIPLSCQETGSCSSDELWVCEPTSMNPRPTGTDVHGCVMRNCEEGRACTYTRNGQNISRCEPTAEGADSLGCVRADCTELADVCLVDQTCDPEAAADAFGCRPLNCLEGAECTAGWRCEPLDAAANALGCVPESGSTQGTTGAGTSAVTTGGGTTTSGAGGSSSSSGASTGTGGTSGAGGTSARVGHCVDP